MAASGDSSRRAGLLECFRLGLEEGRGRAAAPRPMPRFAARQSRGAAPEKERVRRRWDKAAVGTRSAQDARGPGRRNSGDLQDVAGCPECPKRPAKRPRRARAEHGAHPAPARRDRSPQPGHQEQDRRQATAEPRATARRTQSARATLPCGVGGRAVVGARTPCWGGEAATSSSPAHRALTHRTIRILNQCINLAAAPRGPR